MAINPIRSFSPDHTSTIQPAPGETEIKTDQLKSLIPQSPAEIPLEADRVQILKTDYELFKDINPDTHEVEEGVFLKLPYPLIPTKKLEGCNDLQYETVLGKERIEIHNGLKIAVQSQYIGYFPKDCNTEDSSRNKGSHVCIGVFDKDGKLTSGCWEYKQEGLSFKLVGDFTYTTTDTEEKIGCQGYFTFKDHLVVAHGSFVVTRQLKESYFYCTKLPEAHQDEVQETKIDAEGIVRTGIFQGEKLLKGKKEAPDCIYQGEFDAEERLIWGLQTYKQSKIQIRGIWNYQNERRGEISTHCYGVSNRVETGSFINGSLEVGKRKVANAAFAEGRFFAFFVENNVPTYLTIYREDRTSFRWTSLGKYYLKPEDAINKRNERPI